MKRYQDPLAPRSIPDHPDPNDMDTWPTWIRVLAFPAMGLALISMVWLMVGLAFPGMVMALGLAVMARLKTPMGTMVAVLALVGSVILVILVQAGAVPG